MKTMDRLNSGLGISQVLARRVIAAWVVSGIALALAQPARAGWVAAAGGAEASYTQNGTNYHAHIFKTTGTDTFTVTQGGEVEVLVVAGGGGGGQWNAGGGGAGGLIYTSTVVDAGSYSVTVGSGGTGGVGGTEDAEGRSGSNGSDSVFGAFTAIGGGGGGAYSAGLATSGGSGGGGGASPNPTLTAAGTPGQGHAGGAEQSASVFPYAGAGGGGAGAEGQSANPGNGGAGLQYPQFSFAGSPAGWFAGGGGGGGNGGAGAGGSGGGGAGQNGTSPASGGTPGVANTGGGGGGGGLTKQGPGGAGGSGIVIIRYPVPMVFTAASGGTETSYTENGTNYHAHIFATTGTDTLTVTHGGELEVLVVAGGGGGGQWNAGGGGAGGLIYTSTVVDAGSYSVTVGSGGAGGVGGTAHEDGRSGSKGSDSVFGALTAFGGGGGGAYRDGLATSGGSGGGGGWKAGGSLIAAGTEGQGNAGGAEQSTGNTFAGAGGGGAGAEGESLTPGNGGAGLEYPQFASFAGSPAGWFAGGGGGGGNGGSGTGGIGGGGAGQNQVTPASGGTPGVANTGGGGGGGGETGKGPGGAGGSGIVIVRYQAHPNDHLINLDINGYSPSDGLPWTSKCYSGAAVVGAAGDFWNSAAIADSTFETLTAPLLKLADGLTSSTVRFSISRPGGLLRGDCREPDNSVTALLTDYVYLSHENQDSDTFTISGLVPSAAYDLYIYCHAGDAATPGRFTIGGINYDSVNDWLTTGDYAFCPGIAADGNGVITGTFSRLTEGGDAVINGLQIVGTFPVSQAEIVSLDLNGFFGTPPGAGATYSGAARVGWAGDFWNSVAVSDGTVSIAAPNLKLANSIPTTTTVSFSLSTVGGGVVHGNGRPSLNAMFSDYVFIADGSTNRFTIAGLVPNATYDLYFYCHEFNLYNPGRFVINGLTYDSIDMSFPASGGGDTAVCAGITADGSGKITGDVSQAVWNLPVVVNSLQIVGTFPRQHADLVNIDLNGYGPGDDPPPVAGDTYSGAARVGADGDYWNSLTIATETVPSITVPRLKFADGTTKSAVSFTIGRVDGLLNADRIDPANYLNSLMGDYVYYYDGTGTFTIAGLVPNTAYDLYFYCGAGSIYFPVRFEINGATYDSFDRWFAGSTYGDHAVCAGIMADGSGSISGTIYKAIPGSATCVCGVQIMGKIPRMPQGTIIFVR